MKKILKIQILLILSIVFPFKLLCEYEANNWIFGNNCGVSFKEGLPKTFTSSINTIEGCASISDSDGNLLFYSDGVRVWDKEHNVMPNGKNLSGHTSATQSSLIVPKPLNTNQYYLFTLEALENENIRLHYSVVDVQMNNGAGDVIIKNEYLTDNLTEKLCGTRHSNGLDYWIVVHRWQSDELYSYLLTRNGLTNIPVISNIGSIHTGSILNKLGYMKISPNGEKLALVVFDSGFVEIFDFDKSNGRVLNPIKIQMNDFKGIYGLEFSPDSKKLYISTSLSPSRIFQLDLSVHRESEIKKSIKRISSDVTFLFGALQLAPDGKIYVANKLRSYLSAIELPDSIDCGFTLDAIYLDGNICQLGLPAFVSNVFQRVAISANSPLCLGDTLFLNCFNCDNYQLQWSGPNNFSSTIKNPIVTNFSDKNVGVYYLKLTSIDGKEIVLSVNVELFDFEINVIDLSQLDFGKICLGMKNKQAIQLKNNSRFNIEFDKVLLKNGKKYFTIDSIDRNILNAFEKSEVEIYFEPLSIGKSKDTLIIYVASPCREIFEFELQGEGLDSKSYIRIPDNFYFPIGTKDTCVPLIAKLNCIEDIFLNVDYETTILINPYVFYVTSVKAAELIEKFIKNGIQHIKIKGKVEQLDSNERIIGYLCGDALLGDTDTTSLLIDKFKWSNELIEAILFDGFIKVGDICQSNLRLIKRIDDKEIIIVNNIISDNLELLIRKGLSNNFLIRIYDINGSVALSLDFTQQSQLNEYVTLSLPIKNLSSGSYILTIQNDNKIQRLKILIVK